MSDQPLILVRPVETIAEFHAVEDVQRKVWTGTDLDVVPLHMLTTVAHNGGLVLGAFHADRLVGFLLGFLGTDEGQMNRPALARLKHCSHMMGVLPEYQGQDRKSTRLNSSHQIISYAVFCLKKKKIQLTRRPTRDMYESTRPRQSRVDDL